MPVRVSLHAADLHYGRGFVLHTASSGTVPHLSELYLRLDDGTTAGVGEVRTNIGYLNNLEPVVVVADAVTVIGAIDWGKDPSALLDGIDDWAGRHTAPVCA